MQVDRCRNGSIFQLENLSWVEMLVEGPGTCEITQFYMNQGKSGENPGFDLPFGLHRVCYVR